MKQFADDKFNQIIKRNLEARRLEKMGFLKDAVALYEKNVESGDVESGAYFRLASIYRDHHDYANELRVIRSYLQLWNGSEPDHPASQSAIERFRKRLEKVQWLKEKFPDRPVMPIENQF